MTTSKREYQQPAPFSSPHSPRFTDVYQMLVRQRPARCGTASVAAKVRGLADLSEITVSDNARNLIADSLHWAAPLTAKRQSTFVAVATLAVLCLELKARLSDRTPLSVCTMRATHLAGPLSGQRPPLCESPLQVAPPGSTLPLPSTLYSHHRV